MSATYTVDEIGQMNTYAAELPAVRVPTEDDADFIWGFTTNQMGGLLPENIYTRDWTGYDAVEWRHSLNLAAAFIAAESVDEDVRDAFVEAYHKIANG